LTDRDEQAVKPTQFTLSRIQSPNREVLSPSSLEPRSHGRRRQRQLQMQSSIPTSTSLPREKMTDPGESSRLGTYPEPVSGRLMPARLTERFTQPDRSLRLSVIRETPDDLQLQPALPYRRLTSAIPGDTDSLPSSLGLGDPFVSSLDPIDHGEFRGVTETERRANQPVKQSFLAKFLQWRKTTFPKLSDKRNTEPKTVNRTELRTHHASVRSMSSRRHMLSEQEDTTNRKCQSGMPLTNRLDPDTTPDRRGWKRCSVLEPCTAPAAQSLTRAKDFLHYVFKLLRQTEDQGVGVERIKSTCNSHGIERSTTSY
uniref:T-cell acute lymphocytic leukemia 1 n=1 Tax=Echinostoma caproni TaxID=27848 RepID=A0A183AH20_9TREM